LSYDATDTEVKARETLLETLTAEKNKLRQQELSAIEWKPLWGKPAMFAGAVMLVFLATFRYKKKEPVVDAGEAQA
jgi:hypothetical protein